MELEIIVGEEGDYVRKLFRRFSQFRDLHRRLGRHMARMFQNWYFQTGRSSSLSPPQCPTPGRRTYSPTSATCWTPAASPPRRSWTCWTSFLGQPEDIMNFYYVHHCIKYNKNTMLMDKIENILIVLKMTRSKLNLPILSKIPQNKSLSFYEIWALHLVFTCITIVGTTFVLQQIF